MQAFCAKVTLSASSSSLPHHAMPSPLPPAAEILARTRQVYGECASYEDTGSMATVYENAERPQLRRRRDEAFATAFVRPDCFRYEARVSGGQRTLICTTDPDLRSWGRGSDYPSVARSTQMTPALYRLLIPDDQPGPLPSDARVDRTEDCEGTACYVLVSVRSDESDAPFGGTPVEHWIDARSFLLRMVRFVRDSETRLRQRQRLDDWLLAPEVPESRKQVLRTIRETGADELVHTTMTYYPLLDPEIPADRFAVPPIV